MSPKLVKTILVVSILGTLACLALGILINQKKIRYADQLTATEQALRAVPSFIQYKSDFAQNPNEPAATIRKLNNVIQNTQQELTGKASELKAIQQKLAEAVSEKEKLEINLNVAKEESISAQNELNQTRAKMETTESELDALKTDLKGWKPTELFEKIGDLEADVKHFEKKIKSLATQNSKLQNKVANFESEGGEFHSTPGDLTGKIVAVNKPWSFVVLNIGKKNHLKEGTELTVSRGETPIGKVRTVSVDAATSVADILPAATQAEIQVGDMVAVNSLPTQ